MSRLWQGVVKVQVSVFTTCEVPQVLIYDASRRIEMPPGNLQPWLGERMAGAKLKFFRAHLQANPKTGKVDLVLGVETSAAHFYRKPKRKGKRR